MNAFAADAIALVALSAFGAITGYFVGRRLMPPQTAQRYAMMSPFIGLAAGSATRLLGVSGLYGLISAVTYFTSSGIGILLGSRSRKRHKRQP